MTLNMNGSPLTLAMLLRIAETLEREGSITIINCAPYDIASKDLKRILDEKEY